MAAMLLLISLVQPHHAHVRGRLYLRAKTTSMSAPWGCTESLVAVTAAPPPLMSAPLQRGHPLMTSGEEAEPGARPRPRLRPRSPLGLRKPRH